MPVGMVVLKDLLFDVALVIAVISPIFYCRAIGKLIYKSFYLKFYLNFENTIVLPSI